MIFWTEMTKLVPHRHCRLASIDQRYARLRGVGGQPSD